MSNVSYINCTGSTIDNITIRNLANLNDLNLHRTRFIKIEFENLDNLTILRLSNSNLTKID
jgi:Leucine-rich repeat (LRR) protein